MFSTWLRVLQVIGKVLILGIVLISVGVALIFLGLQGCQGMTDTPSSPFQCPATYFGSPFGLLVFVLLTLGLTSVAIAVTEQRVNRLKTQPERAPSS